MSTLCKTFCKKLMVKNLKKLTAGFKITILTVIVN